MPTPIIPFFTDENVPDSVGNALLDAKHEVLRLRECMSRGSKDPLVALTAWANGRVLISHDSDFRAIARRLSTTNREVRERTHWIHLRCEFPNGATRIVAAMSVIESEWLIAAQSQKPMVIEIHDSSIRLIR